MNIKTILGYLLGPVGVGIISLATLPLLTWIFSVEDIGRFSLLQVFVSLLTMFFCLGLDHVYVREFHDNNDISALFKTVLAISLLIFTVVLILLFIYDPLFISIILYDIPSIYLSIISVMCLLFSVISRYLGLTLRMKERSIAYSINQILPKVTLLISILLILLLDSKKDIYLLISLFSLSSIISFLVYSFNNRNLIIKSFSSSIQYHKCKEYLIFGYPLVLAGMASWGMNAMDKVFLKTFSSYKELGIYSVTMSIAGIATIFSGVFNTVWAPQVFKWASQGHDCKPKVETTSEYMLFAISSVLIISALLSWIVPYFLPNDYNDIQYLLTICLMGPLYYTLSEIPAVGLLVSRKPKLTMIASILSVSIGLGLNTLMIPRYGAAGAGISTAITFTIFLFLRSELAKKCWLQTDTKKTYAVVCWLLILSSLQALQIWSFWVNFTVWGLTFIINTLLFRKVIYDLYNYLKKILTTKRLSPSK